MAIYHQGQDLVSNLPIVSFSLCSKPEIQVCVVDPVRANSDGRSLKCPLSVCLVLCFASGRYYHNDKHSGYCVPPEEAYASVFSTS